MIFTGASQAGLLKNVLTFESARLSNSDHSCAAVRFMLVSPYSFSVAKFFGMEILINEQY